MQPIVCVVRAPAPPHPHSPALQNKGISAGSRVQPRRSVLRRNELNKWADRSNYDEHNDDEWEKSQFDTETAALVLRVLTAKATQRLLLQLQELDLFKAQWLTNYLSENPMKDGNKFLLDLMKQPASTVVDSSTATSHTIEPTNLAHRIVQIRAEMASGMAKFPKYAEIQNTEVLRQHLMSSTYVSGSSTGGAEGGDYKERRGYYRQRRR